MPRNSDLMKTFEDCCGLYREGQGVITMNSFARVVGNLRIHSDLTSTGWSYRQPSSYLLPKEFLE